MDIEYFCLLHAIHDMAVMPWHVTSHGRRVIIFSAMFEVHGRRIIIFSAMFEVQNTKLLKPQTTITPSDVAGKCLNTLPNRSPAIEAVSVLKITT